MKKETKQTPIAGPLDENKAKAQNQRRKWTTPQVLWTKKIETFGYQCAGGPVPVNNSSCPTS